MAIVNGYATLTQLRSALGTYATADTTDDAKIELAVEAASRQIDAKLGYRLWQDGTVKTREFYADSPSCCEIPDGISTTTGLIVKTDEDGDGTFETTLTISTDFILLPANAADDTPVRPYTEIRAVENYSFPRLSNGRPGVQVTAQFGWPAVPDWAEQACIIQAIQLFKAKDAPFGVVTFGDMGGGLRAGRGLNPFADALVDPHALPSVG
jgi:hypothetical protein